VTALPQFSTLKLNIQINEGILRDALLELLPQAGICFKEELADCDGILCFSPHCEGPLPFLDFSILTQPLRFLDLLSLLKNLPYSQELNFSHFSLNLRERILKNTKDQKTYRLTGKECQLLHYFYQNKNQEISKDILLKEIWEYHPKTETHTLETHIYRLRQKLEKDPTVPQVLVNCKEGYKLSVGV
jgi:DNA-binding winged helix-turn-helix (wHTH) protein